MVTEFGLSATAPPAIHAAALTRYTCPVSRSPVTELIGKNFGLLIAYVLPGFTALWGLQAFSPTISDWLKPAPTIPAGIESLVFVAMASVGAGMTVSAFRWAIVDTWHAWTGLPRPAWDDANLQANIDAFDTIVEAH